MPLVTPRNWWKPFNREEKIWMLLILAWCLVMFAMMPLGHLWGQNVSQETYRTTPAEFRQATMAFIGKYQVGNEKGLPVVEPPPGDVFLMAQMYQFTPILKLKKGETYRIHMSSADVQHGFSLQPQNLNYQLVPGYDFVVTMAPREAGQFSLICNEYCLYGHHLMVGKLWVDE